VKQASHVCYGTLKDFVISIGFVASHVDGELVLREDQGTAVTAVVLYVDDLMIIANDHLIGLIEDLMKKRFRIHDFGSFSFCLGRNIERNQEHHTIDIHQHC
jgi:hypothetical protein